MIDPPYTTERHEPVAPHRGAAVLVLGILSLVLCAPLGVLAWAMGQRDLALMRSGRMDPSGRGLTLAGTVLGVVGTALSLAVVGFAAVYCISALSR